MDTPFVSVARVIKTHGLQGEVAVKPLLDLPFDLLVGKAVGVVPPVAGAEDLVLTGVRPGPKGPLLSISGVTTLSVARSMAGGTIIVRSSDVPEGWDEDEFDPVGYAVHDTTRGDLGVIEDVIVTGANDVWVVEGPLGQILLPVIDDVVLEVDDDARVFTVALLSGLIDED
jgi:16S rRNA processing protein RimM